MSPEGQGKAAEFCFLALFLAAAASLPSPMGLMLKKDGLDSLTVHLCPDALRCYPRGQTLLANDPLVL